MIAFIRNLASGIFSGMTDSQGNTWTTAVQTTTGTTNGAISYAYLQTALTTADTITGTASTQVNMQIYEYGGITANASPSETSSAVTAAATTLTTGPTGIMANINSLVFTGVGCGTSPQIFTPPSGFNEHIPNGVSLALDVADLIPGNNSSRNAAWNWGTSGAAAVAIATFPLSSFPPAANTDLNLFSTAQYSDVSVDDGDYFIESGAEYLIREYKKDWTNNTDIITFTWKGRSTISSQASPIFIQIYNVTTGLWETLARETRVPADTDFQARVTQSTNLSNYYDASNIVTFRSYQQVN